jgi:hypothetical protein
MKNFIFFIFLITISSACTKGELDNLKLKKPSRPYDVVIEGGINTFHQVQYIRLSSPTFDDDSVAVGISGAKVIVNDGRKDVEFRETNVSGVYSGIVYNANYNAAYKLTVDYKNKEYTAVDTLKQVVSIIDDFLPLTSSVRIDGNIHLTIPKHTFGFLSSAKWLIAYDGIPLWNSSKFDEIPNYSYTHTQGSPNSLYPLISQLREANVKPSDFIFIYKFSLSDQYSKYLYAVFQETDWKGIFSSVPSEIKGNVSEGAVGYFYAIDLDLRRYRAEDLIN